jgi:hypothetical protein
MDTIEKVIRETLTATTKADDYRVYGGRAVMALLKPEYAQTLPDAVRPFMATHDFNVVYLGNNFAAFVGRFVVALDGLFTRVLVTDSFREGQRTVKKASFFSSPNNDGAAPREKRGPNVGAFLTVTDGNMATNALFGRLADACISEEAVKVNDVKYVGMCETLERMARGLAVGNRFLHEKGELLTTRLRVLLHAAGEGGLVQDKVDVKKLPAMARLETYGHLRGVGVRFPVDGTDALDAVLVAHGAPRAASAVRATQHTLMAASGRASMTIKPKAKRVAKIAAASKPGSVGSKHATVRRSLGKSATAVRSGSQKPGSAKPAKSNSVKSAAKSQTTPGTANP